MIELKPCPLCGSDPTIRHFTVNPMFGGGTAYEVKCACGFSRHVEWRSMDVAMNDWNELVNEFERDTENNGYGPIDDYDAYLEEWDAL